MQKLFAILLSASLLLSACGGAVSDGATDGASQSTTSQDSIFTYNESDYAAALAAGNDVFLDFFATWCTICRANQQYIDEALAEIDNPNLVHFVVDYDNEIKLKKEFDIFLQSSYVLIPGGNTDAAEKLGPGLFRTEQFVEFLSN